MAMCTSPNQEMAAGVGQDKPTHEIVQAYDSHCGHYAAAPIDALRGGQNPRKVMGPADKSPFGAARK